MLSLRAVRSLVELHKQDAVVSMEVQSVSPKQLGNQRVVDLQTLTHGETHRHASRHEEIHNPNQESEQSPLSPLQVLPLHQCPLCPDPQWCASGWRRGQGQGVTAARRRVQVS